MYFKIKNKNKIPLSVPICNESDQMTNFSDPEFLATMLSDPKKLRYSAMHPATVIS
jgi:hypothetical protein